MNDDLPPRDDMEKVRREDALFGKTRWWAMIAVVIAGAIVVFILTARRQYLG